MLPLLSDSEQLRYDSIKSASCRQTCKRHAPKLNVAQWPTAWSVPIHRSQAGQYLAPHPYQLQQAQISVSVCVKQVGQNSNVLVWVSASCCHTAQGHKQDIRYANYDIPGIHIVIKHYGVAAKFCGYKDPSHNSQLERYSDPATIHHTGDMKTLHQ